MRKGRRLQLEGVVHTLQVGEGLSLHVGCHSALALQGHEHYLRQGEAATITLYGPDRLPAELLDYRLPNASSSVAKALLTGRSQVLYPMCRSAACFSVSGKSICTLYCTCRSFSLYLYCPLYRRGLHENYFIH
ncbi:AbiEi antitoxin N-terminal domain-containing protein [Halomonas sp. PR-M31]|uniref:AbiEi antitoxin N-terminal domain-containing protein n=1 Tax=Halomonas sp. PR-M31 TaxID=1471202 RepID=UPI00209F3735|nr:AbiEi antitoxin N-terminal domain-containing protein [Halomonas sp. PR-M31]